LLLTDIVIPRFRSLADTHSAPLLFRTDIHPDHNASLARIRRLCKKDIQRRQWPFDDLIKDERAGVRTIRVTVKEERIEVEIADLVNGVEIPEDRVKRAKEEERLGSVKRL
jgi:hypothetical protein